MSRARHGFCYCWLFIGLELLFFRALFYSMSFLLYTALKLFIYTGSKGQDFVEIARCITTIYSDCNYFWDKIEDFFYKYNPVCFPKIATDLFQKYEYFLSYFSFYINMIFQLHYRFQKFHHFVDFLRNVWKQNLPNYYRIGTTSWISNQACKWLNRPVKQYQF